MSSFRAKFRTVSRWRFVVALGCFVGAIILLVHAGQGQPDWPFDFVLPQPPPEPVTSTAASDPLLTSSGPDARRKVLDRSRELSALAQVPSQRPPRERRIEIRELPPEIAKLLPPLPQQPASDSADEVAQ